MSARQDYHRTAGSQRRADLPGQHQQWKIPRQHSTDDTDRFAHHHRHRVLTNRRCLVIELVDSLGMPDQCGDGLGNIDGGAITNGLAGIQRLKHCQLMPVATDQFGKADQHLLAFSRMKTAPASVIEGLARLAGGKIDIIGIAGCNLRQHLAGGRIDAVEGGARRRLAKSAIDKGCRGQCQPLGNRVVFFMGQQL